MNKNISKLLAVSALALLATGCQTTTHTIIQENNSAIPADKYIITQTFDERLQRSAKKISNKMALLKSLDNPAPVTVTPVEHLQGYNGRTSQDMKDIVGPHFYDATSAYGVSLNESLLPSTTTVDNAKVAKFNDAVSNFNWENSSLNELVLEISNKVGYNFVVVKSPKGVSDIQFTLKSTQPTTIVKILDNVARVNADSADIIISHAKQTITVNYNK